jgi:hemolysin activation/secretion protein
VLPLQEEFSAGGKGTLPGYKDHEFSGDRTLLLRTRLSWVPFGYPEQKIQYRIYVGLNTGNAWTADEVDGVPPLKTDVAIGTGIFFASDRLIPFPMNISVAWAKPISDRDRDWLFQINILGGALR